MPRTPEAPISRTVTCSSPHPASSPLRSTSQLLLMFSLRQRISGSDMSPFSLATQGHERERSFGVMTKMFWNQIGPRWRNVMNRVNATASKLCHVYLSKIKRDKQMNRLSPGFSSGQSPKGGRIWFTPHFIEEHPEVPHGEGEFSRTPGILGRGWGRTPLVEFHPLTMNFWS